MLDEHFGGEGDGEGGVFGRVQAFGVGVNDFLDAGDWGVLVGWRGMVRMRGMDVVEGVLSWGVNVVVVENRILTRECYIACYFGRRGDGGVVIGHLGGALLALSLVIMEVRGFRGPDCW